VFLAKGMIILFALFSDAGYTQQYNGIILLTYLGPPLSPKM
jgi:hypothetical protein